MGVDFKRLEKISCDLKETQQSGKNFHVTFIYKKNKRLAVAHNNYNKGNSYHKFISQTPDYQAGLHSECAALIKLGKVDCSKLTFINVRIGADGKAAMSKPCKNCEEVLKQVGFKTLWYYNGKEYVSR